MHGQVGLQCQGGDLGITTLGEEEVVLLLETRHKKSFVCLFV